MKEKLFLGGLRIGQSAYVSAVEAQPQMRRRLLDVGLIPGTRVTCVAGSPAGDPSAYLIRGAVIALRRADAAGVAVERAPEQDAQRHMALA